MREFSNHAIIGVIFCHTTIRRLNIWKIWFQKPLEFFPIFAEFPEMFSRQNLSKNTKSSAIYCHQKFEIGAAESTSRTDEYKHV